ncbi:hypothetical protein D3C85_1695730 [compost metagenome]
MALPRLDAGFVLKAHGAPYGRLAPADRTTKDGLVVEPAALRQVDVRVGRHSPPVWHAHPKFMEHHVRPRTAEFQLIAIACAHYRMA